MRHALRACVGRACRVQSAACVCRRVPRAACPGVYVGRASKRRAACVCIG
uniref:Uncharacterized protein n=1 Tax=Cucumis melo TaxID=3656 RepID=A0A9I9E1I1_CUCME